MRLVGLMVGGCAVLALAGCSKAVDGQPEASGAPLTKEQLFDPCTVPESALVGVGADPTSKDDNPFSVQRAEWKGCMWSAGDHFISILATTHTLPEYRTNDHYHDFKDVTISGRVGLQYGLGNRKPADECGIVFDSAQGRIEVIATKKLSSKSTIDPCAVVNDAAPYFVDSLPK